MDDANGSPGPGPFRIVLVGDSTVTDHAGWGRGFAARLTPEAECVNCAVGGRSSKSYRDEGRWEAALALRPSCMLIQFGHNDCPGKGAHRETDPATTFRWNMTRYAAEARAAGVLPVLVTPLTRRLFGPDGRLRSNLVAYADAVMAAATATRVPVVDLHALSIAACDALGEKGCEELSPGRGGKVDTTHLNAHGGEVIGAIVAQELGRVLPELARFLR